MKLNPVSLDLIQIASPCQASWDAMTGDDRMRFCRDCKLHVYNLSEISRAEAETFLQEREGRTCVRLYRRSDGTVLTRDCPVGVRTLRRRFVRSVAALASLLLALFSSTVFGGVLNRWRPHGVRSPNESFSAWIDPNPEFQFWMGAMVIPTAAQQPPTTETASDGEPNE